MFSSVVHMHTSTTSMGRPLTPFSFCPFPQLDEDAPAKVSLLQTIRFYTPGTQPC
jgi:hypothetical protein